ncbi:hypothetical protein G3M48_000256 [Beauveria asiatica]|uniref:tripeptidyl-peptidase II n=1 Tax=Beauveria asiatica TaxID=1069075 RepID=A0AAW0S1M8_9HYPO
MSFFFSVATLAASASARSVVLEHVPVLPADWKQLDNVVDSAGEVSFSIALKQPNIDIPALMAQGGKHISLDEVRAMRAPDRSCVDRVMKWLRDENISNVRQERDMIHVHTTVADAEKLLSGNFSHHAHGGKVSELRTQEYSIPEELADSISFINPVANFMRPSGDDNQTAPKIPCHDGVGISCLKKLYNITYESPDSNSPARLGISGYLELHANHDDVRAFLSKQTNITNYDFKVKKVNGGEDPGTPVGTEAVLDLEYGMGIGYPASVTYYATGGRGDMIDPDGQLVKGIKSDNEPYLEFINHLLEKPDEQLPHVLSVSYGEDELSVPKQYAKRVCDAYGLLTKRGTIIHASGNGGSTGGHYGKCRSRDGKNTNITMPTFPASCPWVTTASAADGYIRGLDGHLDGYYNKNGRAIPDVSIVGDNFWVMHNGTSKYIWGTSASAPVFAAMITLVNDARLRAGKQSVGYINELLYSKEGVAAFSDITRGTSYHCDFAARGWPATQCWDAVTGLGEPRDFSKLMKLLYAA